MRPIVLTAVAMLAAAPAFASSIETIAGPRLANGSMVNIRCADCPPPKPPEARSTYRVPTLEEGVQKEEIREVNGERMLMRTDRWMGGSPTVFYQKLTPETEAAMTGKPVIGGDKPPVAAGVAPPDDGIDASATTAAVSAAPARAVDDFSGFELRLR